MTDAEKFGDTTCSFEAQYEAHVRNSTSHLSSWQPYKDKLNANLFVEL